jgi:hypothetical protein
MELERTTPAGARQLNADDLGRLRPHVINLTQGRFSSTGRYTTTPSDVDAIFDEYLPRFIEASGGHPVPLMIWAHGGLIDEEKGLLIAQGQIDWWLSNGVYPLHFVWESGALDAIKQILGPTLATRDLADYTVDPMIEVLVRPIASKLWLAMKQSAQLASQPASGVDPQGGAHYTAVRLAKFTRDHPSAISLHAAGHSAGSIFHAHFIPAARAAGVPSFASLALLAPAISVPLFKSTLATLVGEGRGIDEAAVFTMRREHERDDSVIGVYRKSLLYLVSRALEPDADMPILGLEDSLRGDPDLVSLFGLNTGSGQTDAEVLWSVSSADAPIGRRTHSTSHGGFDNDNPTLESVAYRVLRSAGVADPVVKLPKATSVETGRAVWRDYSTGPMVPIVDLIPTAAQSFATSAPAPVRLRRGKRHALCIGIDSYPTKPLSGAVADAKKWANALRGLGFSVTTLHDAEASRAGIIDAFTTLLAEAEDGDVVVFQYAGHGTTVPDLYLGPRPNGEETDGRDEALCPHDYDQVGLLLDDDVYAIVATHLKSTVGLTGFLDCCHSGSAFRGFKPQPPPTPGGWVDRYLPFTPSMLKEVNKSRAARPVIDVRHQVMFSACQDDEVAWESGGVGHFTKSSMSVLDDTPRTNAQFLADVKAQFGTDGRQHPGIQTFEDPAPERIFLAPIGF